MNPPTFSKARVLLLNICLFVIVPILGAGFFVAAVSYFHSTPGTPMAFGAAVTGFAMGGFALAIRVLAWAADRAAHPVGGET